MPKMFGFWGHDSVNNMLKFLGMAVSIMLLIREAGGENCPCLLALGDNTSATGWICRLGRLPKTSCCFKPVKLIARTVARAATAADAPLMAQHLKGTCNNVSDLLSFDNVLTERIHVFHPQVVLEGFKISPLPKEILSFVFDTRRIVDSKQEEFHSRVDRVWRRWKQFTQSQGLKDPLIVGLQGKEQTLVCKCFPVGLRDGKFDINGRAVGRLEKLMVESTLRDAIIHLAETFRANERPSPMRNEEEGVASGPLRQSIQDLLRAFGNRDPPQNKQKAMTSNLVLDTTAAEAASCKSFPLNDD